MSMEGLITGLYERLDKCARDTQTLAFESILGRCDLYLSKIGLEKIGAAVDREVEEIEETEDEKTLRQIQAIALDYLFETGEHNIRELHDAVGKLTVKPRRDMLKKLVELL